MRISGVSVGKVKVDHADKKTGASDATIELDAAYAPIPKDTKAILRQKTLLGETYVELTPGLHERRDGPRERQPAGRRGVADRRARRDLPRLRPQDARGVPDLDAAARARLAGPRARHLRRAGQPRAVRARTPRRC